jgi:hypothetical protein
MYKNAHYTMDAVDTMRKTITNNSHQDKTNGHIMYTHRNAPLSHIFFLYLLVMFSFSHKPEHNTNTTQHSPMLSKKPQNNS